MQVVTTFDSTIESLPDLLQSIAQGKTQRQSAKCLKKSILAVSL